ncbi:MAG: hypothetical protein KF857_06235 [Fimbriimonadaceae bacterium]|nr:hypothetical protein [Fimbriimonadaceae bacterium]
MRRGLLHVAAFIVLLLLLFLVPSGCRGRRDAYLDEVLHKWSLANIRDVDLQFHPKLEIGAPDCVVLRSPYDAGKVLEKFESYARDLGELKPKWRMKKLDIGYQEEFQVARDKALVVLVAPDRDLENGGKPTGMTVITLFQLK